MDTHNNRFLTLMHERLLRAVSLGVWYAMSAARMFRSTLAETVVALPYVTHNVTQFFEQCPITKVPTTF